MSVRVFLGLAVLGLLCGATGVAWAQQPTSIFQGDPLTCFKLEGPGTARLVAVPDQPFAQAWDVVTPPYSGNFYDIRLRCFATQPVQQGDTVLVTFWMRTISAQDGAGHVVVALERGGPPYTKSVMWTATAGSTWEKKQIAFPMAETYSTNQGQAGNGYNLGLWVTFNAQEIQIGGITGVNYGSTVAVESLGTAWPYEGHDPNASWRADAAQRIERIRKADVVVMVRDASGNPIPGAQVHVKQTRHAFPFGTAVAGPRIQEQGPDAQRYRDTIVKLFNAAVFGDDMKWPYWEVWGKIYAPPSIAWLRQNGISVLRGHNLIWPSLGNLPADVVTMLQAPVVDKAALRARIAAHFADIMGATKGQVADWDVINEPFTNHDVQDVLGDQEMTAWFQNARALDPNAKLYVNDFNITESTGYDASHQNGLYAIVSRILAGGGPLDGIGLQSHFSVDLTPPARVLEILDRFAGFGKDLKITEFDVTTANEQLQADYTRDFMTVAFSHPAVKGFYIWGFWEGVEWSPPAALIRLDWSTKPNYDVWMDLVYRQWWTDVQGATGADGTFRTRGFLGNYDVQITTGGQTQTVPLTVTAPGPNYVVLGKQTPGSFSAAGVVNAASFRGGAVAPGEMVEIWGDGFGPSVLAQASYDDTGHLPASLADTQVFFDGIQAPVVHVLPGRVTAVVPSAVSGSSKVQVEYQGVKTSPVTVPVSAVVPGIFCYSGGTGQAVAVNYNLFTSAAGDLNSPDKPADRGSYITLFLTGQGQTIPQAIDGLLPVYPANPQPAQALIVKFGDVQSSCLYNWSGLVYAGITQVNACIPANAPTGPAVPVTVSSGTVSSQAGVTVAIR